MEELQVEPHEDVAHERLRGLLFALSVAWLCTLAAPTNVDHRIQRTPAKRYSSRCCMAAPGLRDNNSSRLGSVLPRCSCAAFGCGTRAPAHPRTRAPVHLRSATAPHTPRSGLPGRRACARRAFSGLLLGRTRSMLSCMEAAQVRPSSGFMRCIRAGHPVLLHSLRCCVFRVWGLQPPTIPLPTLTTHDNLFSVGCPPGSHASCARKSWRQRVPRPSDNDESRPLKGSEKRKKKALRSSVQEHRCTCEGEASE